MINKLKDLRAGGEEEGFTLIELMIVVVIIGILAAIAIPVFANQQKSAINAGVISDVKNTNTNIATALAKAPTSNSVSTLIGLDEGQGFDENFANTIAANPQIERWQLAKKNVIRSDQATEIRISGGWDNYEITATNSSTVFSATYKASSGKITTEG